MTRGQAGAADQLIGTKIGSYRVERRLGEGGMGAVYELLHPGIGKRLAMKLLHSEYASRPQIVKRFFDEARSVNMIRHPNIVDVIDFAELPDGRSYLTMEFLEGESLDSYIKRRGALPPEEVLAVALPICSALGAAHARGIVHRDLKPENVHLTPRHDNPLYVKVLDFGIAKLSSELQLQPGDGTRSGVVMGTPTYMSPEQAMGRTKEIDHRTDIYALGIILYEMLTGTVPFAAESFGDLMLKHLQETPQPIAQLRPDLPGAWNQVVQRALAKRREDRFQSMDEMARAIQSAAGGQPIGASPAAIASAATAVAMQPGLAASPVIPGPGGTMAYSHPGTGAGSVAPGSGVPGSAVPGSGMSGSAVSGPHGTMAYGQEGAVPSGAAPSVVGVGASPVPAARKRRLLVPITVGAIALATAVAVFLIVQRNKRDNVAPTDDPAGAAGATPIDAGARSAATPPVDAAVVAKKAATPDAAAAAVAAKPGPAPAPSGNATSTPKRPHRDRERGHGYIMITALPWAYVSIDGKRMSGQTPMKVKVKVGTRRVRVWNPEAGTAGRNARRTVKVKKGHTSKLFFDFSG